MQGECERGATPNPDLTNLNVYYEIGAELDLENIELLDERSYRALYLERLAKWNALRGDPAGQSVLAGRRRNRRAATGRCRRSGAALQREAWRSAPNFGTREAHDG